MFSEKKNDCKAPVSVHSISHVSLFKEGFFSLVAKIWKYPWNHYEKEIFGGWTTYCFPRRNSVSPFFLKRFMDGQHDEG